MDFENWLRTDHLWQGKVCMYIDICCCCFYILNTTNVILWEFPTHIYCILDISTPHFPLQPLLHLSSTNRPLPPISMSFQRIKEKYRVWLLLSIQAWVWSHLLEYDKLSRDHPDFLSSLETINYQEVLSQGWLLKCLSLVCAVILADLILCEYTIGNHSSYEFMSAMGPVLSRRNSSSWFPDSSPVSGF